MILGIINIIPKISKRVKNPETQKETSFQFHDGKIICLLHFVLIYENLPNMRIFFGIFIWIITATSIFPIHIVSMIFAGLKFRPLINQKIIKFCHLQELKPILFSPIFSMNFSQLEQLKKKTNFLLVQNRFFFSVLDQ